METYIRFMKKVDSTELYDGIRLLVLSARQAVARGVNLLQVHTNYEIGRRIVEREQGGADRAQYGKEVIMELAERLTSGIRQGVLQEQPRVHAPLLPGLSRSKHSDCPDAVRAIRRT